MSTKKLILLAGAADKSELLECLHHSGLDLIALVVPDSDKYRDSYRPMLSRAQDLGISTISAQPKKLNEAIQDIDFDILISSGYPFVIPREVFSRAKHAINFHPTLLPKYRGRYLHYILINNDKETGVTAHLIDDSLDTGPIVKQIKYPVSAFDTVRSLSRKNIVAEVELALDIIKDLNNGTINAYKQDESQASSFFEKRTPEDSEIDPHKALSELFHEIRCCDPELYPAYFMVDGQKVYINVYRKDKPDNEFDMI